MLFNNNFYNIQHSNITEQNAIFSIILNKNHSIYKGHFPGNPVTPGVVQLEIIKELISLKTNKSISLLSIINCKFLAVLAPDGSLLNIELDFTNNNDGTLKIAARITNLEKVFLKLSAVYIQSN